LPGLEDLRNAVGKLLRRTGPYEQIVNEYIRDLQRALISADVNVRLVFQLTKRIRERALKEKPPPGVSRREWLVKLTYDELVKVRWRVRAGAEAAIHALRHNDGRRPGERQDNHRG